MIPGKTILFGEHAVVYGKPGIAAPVLNLGTTVTIKDSEIFSLKTNQILTSEQHIKLNDAINFILNQLNMHNNLSIEITSNLPIASGLGSSASLCVAMIKALKPLNNEHVNDIAFECEKIFHGNPSGIDNAVITYEKPIFFQNKEVEFIELTKSISLLIANTGIRSDTKNIVSEVRNNYENNKEKYSRIFDEIEIITNKAKTALESNNLKELGSLMNKNHTWLKKLGVSSPELDLLVSNAKKAGALGAKLSGAGQGGNMIALVDENKEKVLNELKENSPQIIETTIQ